MLRRQLASILLAALAVAPAFAQWQYKLPPADSPYWWTLTDEITPEQLRRLYSKESHQERYLDAVRAGLFERLSDEEMEHFLIFVDGRLTPELHRLPAVLGTFLSALNWRPDSDIPKLKNFGFTDSEISFLIETAAVLAEELEMAHQETGLKVGNFLQLSYLAAEHFTSDEFRKILRTRDYGALASISEYSPREVEELALAWDYEPLVELEISAARAIRNHLPPVRWQLLRRYLLTEESPNFEYLDIDEFLESVL